MLVRGDFNTILGHTSCALFVCTIMFCRSWWFDYTQTGRVELFFLTGQYNSRAKSSSGKQNSKTLDPKSRHKVLNTHFKDIIQVPIREHYLNLTLKTIAMVKWAEKFCTSAKYVLKHDDDTYVNIASFLHEIDNLKQMNIDRFMYGAYAPAHVVPQDGLSYKTWRVNNESYPLQTFPHYAQGFFYMYTQSLAPDLLKAMTSRDSPVINIEDIYLTGIVRVVSRASLIVRDSVLEQCSLFGFEYHDIIAMHRYDYSLRRCANSRIHVDKNLRRENQTV